MNRSKKVAAFVATAVVAGSVMAQQAAANVTAVCTNPGLVQAKVFNFVNPGNHTVTLWTNLTQPKTYTIVGRQDNFIDLVVPEGDITVYMSSDGKTYTSDAVHCANPAPVEEQPTTSQPPVVPPKKVTPKKVRKPMTCKRFKATHPKAPAGAYRRMGFKPNCGILPPPPPKRVTPYNPPVAG